MVWVCESWGLFVRYLRVSAACVDDAAAWMAKGKGKGKASEWGVWDLRLRRCAGLGVFIVRSTLSLPLSQKQNNYLDLLFGLSLWEKDSNFYYSLSFCLHHLFLNLRFGGFGSLSIPSFGVVGTVLDILLCSTIRVVTRTGRDCLSLSFTVTPTLYSHLSHILIFRVSQACSMLLLMDSPCALGQFDAS